jgi:hypothetical protein
VRLDKVNNRRPAGGTKVVIHLDDAIPPKGSGEFDSTQRKIQIKYGISGGQGDGNRGTSSRNE